MLCRLFVKNFALLDEICLDFKSGLTVFSGETGAGKSLVVGSLALLSGGKASPALIRTGAPEAIVEAVFDLSGNRPLLQKLTGMGLEEEGELVVRRQIAAEGKNRIFVNGRSITLSQLENLAAHLIDVVGQYDQQILLKEENHRLLLDGAEDPKLLSYRALFAPCEKLKGELEAQKRKQTERDQKIEWITFQLKEIGKAEIAHPREEEELLGERGRTKNAAFLTEAVREARSVLTESEPSHLDGLNNLYRRMEKAVSLDPTLEEGRRLIEGARNHLQEAASFFERYSEKLSVDPQRIEEIEGRLYQFQQLKKKFGPTLEDVLKRQNELKGELEGLSHLDETIEKGEKELKNLSSRLLAEAKGLSEERQKKARRLEGLIAKELADLSMPKVRFKMAVLSPSSPSVADCGPDGFDTVRFEFSANPGEALKPLAQIASGGELSRILLAIKKVLGGPKEEAISVFDEVDAGIGGAVAEMVGRKLKEMASDRQVICVTHLPQIASQADHHYIIEKGTESGRTKTGVRSLQRMEEREDELARMLGGVTITDKTRAHAREMLKGAKIV